MSYAIYKGEKNMSELVSRLFGLQGKGTQSAIKQAADALLKTNPQLKDFSKVAVGSVIAVPGTAPPLQSAVQANEFTVMRSSAVMSAQQAFSAPTNELRIAVQDRFEQLELLPFRRP